MQAALALLDPELEALACLQFAFIEGLWGLAVSDCPQWHARLAYNASKALRVEA